MGVCMCAVLVVRVVFTRGCQSNTQNSQYTQIQIVLTQIFLRFSTLYNVTNCVQMISVKLGTTIGAVCDNIYTGVSGKYSLLALQNSKYTQIQIILTQIRLHSFV